MDSIFEKNGLPIKPMAQIELVEKKIQEVGVPVSSLEVLQPWKKGGVEYYPHCNISIGITQYDTNRHNVSVMIDLNPYLDVFGKMSFQESQKIQNVLASLTHIKGVELKQSYDVKDKPDIIVGQHFSMNCDIDEQSNYEDYTPNEFLSFEQVSEFENKLPLHANQDDN
ncbi:MAG: hypothetical protein IBX55_00085 [Methyloprofundus sp.]|nr:hypothetical protein [Methyloprofundus sp.]